MLKYYIICHNRRKHSHEKRFCSNVCGSSFVKYRHLVTHKEYRHLTVKCDICDYSSDGIASYNHHKKIHYPPEITFELTQRGRGLKNKPHF